jgi:hypothetical protein
MESRGVRPNGDTHALMIRAFAKDGAIEDILAYLQNLCKCGVSPPIHAYYALPILLRKKQDLFTQEVPASYVLQSLPKNTGLLNRFLMEIVKNVPQSPFFDKTIQIMNQYKIGCDPICYTALANAYIKSNQPLLAAQIVQQLEENSNSTDQYIVAMKLQVYGLCNEVTEAIQYIRQLEKREIKLNPVVYTHLLDIIGPSNLALVREIYNTSKCRHDRILFNKLLQLHLVNAELYDIGQLMITLETSNSEEIKNDPASNAAILQALLQIDKAAGWEFVKRHHEKKFNYETMLHFMRAYITHFADQSDFRQLQHYIWLFSQIFRVFPDFKALQMMRDVAPDGVRSIAHKSLYEQNSLSNLNQLMHRLYRSNIRTRRRAGLSSTRSLMSFGGNNSSQKQKQASFDWDLKSLEGPDLIEDFPDFDPLPIPRRLIWDEL